MTLLYTSPDFLRHDTGQHPERADRLRHVTRRLESSAAAAACQRPPWKALDAERLLAVHGREYVAQVRRFAAGGGGRIESDTVLSEASYDVACLAAGAACDAVARVVRGEDRQALCLVRPPGHHALTDHAMGFCLFNNVALAARSAVQEQGLDRVLVVDWDVHHGNGTQATFWEDPQVGFLSIHRFPFYPGSGAAHETGGGPGLGMTRNLPVAFGTTRHDYLTRLSNELETFAAHVKPQLVLLSAGFDAHREDPIGSLGLETEDFGQLTQLVLDAADAHAEGRLVSLLEGGYHLERLADSVALHLETMHARESG